MKTCKLLAVLIIAGASALMVFCFTRVYGIIIGYRADRQAYSQLDAAAKPRTTSALSKLAAPGAASGAVSSSFLAERAMAAEPEPAPQPTAFPQSDIDFNTLAKINADITGWIEIPGTKLNYPIVQASDNDYYLTRRYDKQESRAGAIFLDCAASAGMDDTNTFIFGHNMKDGSMFAMLHDYADPGFYDANPYIYITLPDGFVRTYKIFSVHKASVDSGDYKGGVWNEEMYDAYVGEAVRHSMYDTGYRPQDNAPLIALSTCIRGESDNRFVVHAALI